MAVIADTQQPRGLYARACRNVKPHPQDSFPEVLAVARHL
jgi:hypothetical protein